VWSAVGARGLHPDRGRELLVLDPDQRERLLGGAPVDRGDRGDLLPGVAYDSLVTEQVDGGANAVEGASGREVEGDHARVGVRRPQEQALELSLVAHVGRVDRLPRHLGTRLDARGGRIDGVEAAGAGVAHRGDDPEVRAAAAQVPRERKHDVLPRRLLVAALMAPAVVEGDRLDNEPRRAVAALQCVVGDERPLHGMELGTEPLDGRHLTAVERGRREQAARDRDAVQQHRARPAHALTADQLGAGQAEAVTQHFDRGLLRAYGGLVRLTVDRKADHRGVS
jgi:hypothetical protein